VSKLNVLDRLVRIVESMLKLPSAKVDVEAHLESLGINSLITMELISHIEGEFGVALTPAMFADVETLADLAAVLERAQAPATAGLQAAGPSAAAASPDVLGYVRSRFAVDLSGRSFGSLDEIADTLVAEHTDALLRRYGSEVGNDTPSRRGDIAIVGLSCRLPDAPDARCFWNNLLEGKSSAREIPASRWNWEQHYAELPSPGKSISRWGALIEDVDCFDAGFFDISAQEASAMDPQQRLLLEEAYRAFEDAGADVAGLAGTNTGVFVGYQYSEYEQQLRKLGNIDMRAGPLFSSSSPSYYLANRISFAFDLRGPSESINLNCASSAVALNRAYYSLVSGESDIALAAGVSLNLFEGDYIASSQYGLLSRDGTSGVFDDDANGFTRGEGVAALVLKRLEDAERDSDRIYAVIKSSHQNYRGAAKSLSEIRHEPITEVLRACYAKAGVEPATVRYVEVDGYATKWADSFEYEGVKNALQGSGGGKSCALGSAKGNIGNVEAASGVTNVIKVALSLHHKIFPATISVRKVSSFIDIDSTAHPLYIADRAIPFDTIRSGDTPIRAGVNSFADSGTNVHLLLEEYVPAAAAAAAPSTGPQLFVLSARDEERLAAQIDNCLHYLTGPGQAETFDSLVYTSQVGRAGWEERLAVVASGHAELADKLARASRSGGRGLESSGIYRGRASSAEDNPLAGLISGDMAAMQLEQCARAGQWTQAALLWVNGVRMPWRQRWQGRSVRPASIPGYPFARTRHWMDILPARAATVPAAAGGHEAPGANAAASFDWDIAPRSVEHPHPDAQALDGTAKIILFLRQETARLLRQPVESIALDRTLPELGMNSIRVTELILQVDKLMGIQLSPSALFRHPSISALAAHLAATCPERADALVAVRQLPAAGPREPALAPRPASEMVVPVQAQGSRVPIYALPGAGGNALSLQQLSHALGSEQPFYCIESAGLDGQTAPLASVEEIARFNIECLKAAGAPGPYRLLGYSNGGVVAFEMARQLLESGDKVASLVLLDTLCPPARAGHPVEEMLVAVFNRFAQSLGAPADLTVEALRETPESRRSEFLHDLLAKRGFALPWEQFAATFDVATSSENLCRAYQPSRLASRIEVVLFKAADSYRGAPGDYGWGEFVNGPMRTLQVRADHFSIVEKGPVREIARKIAAQAGKAAMPATGAELEAVA
jgi:polyketide synthase PksN